MAVTVYDETGEQYIVGDVFSLNILEQPLVTERRQIYSFPFGDAELVQIGFSGIFIVYGDMQVRQNRILNFDVTGDIDLVEMHFTLAGNGYIKNRSTGREYSFKSNEHNMHYSPVFMGSGEYRGQVQYKFFEVHFTTRFFFELAKDSSPILMQFAEQIQKGKDSELYHDNLPISFAMHQCINDIMNCKVTGGLKLLFLQSKCIELLALQAQMYEDAMHRSVIICKSDYDKDCIHFAKEYLLQHSVQPPSLTELAKIAGINEFKLKQGFKEVFNNTVFGYLTDYKLNQARDLLLTGHIAIKDVADQLGYSSVQHFNSAFRKKFGVPPGKLNVKR
jgi:AraC-like DNA-binding protein